VHQHRHILGPNRSVRGIRILNDSGITLHLDEAAAGSSIKIWWDGGTATEQILVDGVTYNVEADVDLGGGSPIAHPPTAAGNPPTQRIRSYTVPSTDGRGIEKVEVIKNGASIFTATTRLDRVMIWDTVDT
jgi:hypothetical protein